MNLNLNLKEFLKYLKRFKWLLIIVPVVCVIITYFLASKLPRQYQSEALISTGLTSRLQGGIGADQNMDYFKLSQQFGNLLELMRSKKRMTALSYILVLHDLENPEQAFRPYPEEVQNMTPAQKQELIAAYRKKAEENSLISVADNGKLKLYDILGAFGYNEASLAANLETYRSGESDFIKVVFTSESPLLSAYVVNTLGGDFIQYYTNLVNSNRRQSIASLDTILKEKQSEMSRKNAQLSSSAAGMAASAASAMTSQQQADFVNQQIGEAEGQRIALIRNMSSIMGALNEINSKLASSGGNSSTGTSSSNNSDIINIDNQISIANSRYVNNNFRAEDKASLDSLQRIKTRLLSSTSDRSGASSSLGIRQGLLNDKIRLESDLAAAKSTLSVVEQQLKNLGPRRSGGSAPMVGDANQAALARDAEMAAKAYADVQSQYEQTTMLSKSGVQLNIAEPGLPEPPQPSKKVLYLAFSGISSAFICLLSLFIAFAFNTSVNTPEQLANATKQRVIGSLNYITEENKDLRNIWENDDNIPGYMIYRDLLRSLRFELNKLLTDESKVLGITSFADGDGKSFLAGSLSYAFAMMGKNVLLICENHEGLTSLVTNKTKEQQNNNQLFESFLVKKEIKVEDRITILNRNQSDKSLLELKDSKSLFAGFQILKDTFDIVILDINSSQQIHNVKEWLMFCDKSVAVFPAGKNMQESDKEFINFLAQQKTFAGWVLNKANVLSTA